VFPEDGQELTLKTYVRNLRKWRDHFEEMLDQRPQKMYLEQFSPWLSDFQFQKFDEVEVPGQYLQVFHSIFYTNAAA
jgi:transformation/transcription domain-associated protein